MRAHGNEGRLGRRFLLAAGLTIAVVVPSAAFGGTARFDQCDPRWSGGGCRVLGTINVERGKGKKNKRVKAVSFNGLRVNCPKSGPQTVGTYLGVPASAAHPTGDIFRNEIPIDAKVRHRKWHFNGLVPDAVGRSSNERIDASINFRGKFRKNDKDKADGTLEVTLEGGATYLYPEMSGTELIVIERPIVDFEPEGCHGVWDFHVDLFRQ